jgi:menaquinone-specific isochorismate synthase
LSITLPLPALCLRGVPELAEGAVYWHRPDAGQVLCGVGSAFQLITTGPGRFAELRQRLSELPAYWLQMQEECCTGPAHLMLNFSFGADQADPASEQTRLHLPEVMVEQHGHRPRMTFSSPLPTEGTLDGLVERWLRQAEGLLIGLTREMPAVGQVQRLLPLESSPTRSDWLSRVDEARRLIRRGEFSKVVLSRQLRVQAERIFSAPRVLNWLQGHYPSCTHFACVRPEGTLICASPERLVSLRDGVVRSDALASTTVRSFDHAEDTYLEQELVANPKARQEHALVVDAIVQGLRPLCQHMGAPPAPRIMKLETLQHLWTPIEGTVKPETTLLDCAERLHPTPAVGGYPRAPALSWLASQGEERGWFTGGVGWVTAQGEGELAVVLRCAMLRGNEAAVFAGAGIVADSDPHAELGETELKMRVMLAALASAGSGPGTPG